MSAWDDQHWNLAQAAGWVVYRDRRVVEELARPGPKCFALIGFYPTMQDYTARGSLNDLRDALLVATGRRANGDGHRETIPKVEWLDLMLDPPGAGLREGQVWREPWINIAVTSGDTKRLWRGELITQHDVWTFGSGGLAPVFR